MGGSRSCRSYSEYKSTPKCNQVALGSIDPGNLILNIHLDGLKERTLVQSGSRSHISTVGESGTNYSVAEGIVVESMLPTQGIHKLRLGPQKIMGF